jgi:hypothetical protein
LLRPSFVRPLRGAKPWSAVSIWRGPRWIELATEGGFGHLTSLAGRFLQVDSCRSILAGRFLQVDSCRSILAGRFLQVDSWRDDASGTWAGRSRPLAQGLFVDVVRIGSGAGRPGKAAPGRSAWLRRTWPASIAALLRGSRWRRACRRCRPCGCRWGGRGLRCGRRRWACRRRRPRGCGRRGRDLVARHLLVFASGGEHEYDHQENEDRAGDPAPHGVVGSLQFIEPLWRRFVVRRWCMKARISIVGIGHGRAPSGCSVMTTARVRARFLNFPPHGHGRGGMRLRPDGGNKFGYTASP